MQTFKGAVSYFRRLARQGPVLWLRLAFSDRFCPTCGRARSIIPADPDRTCLSGFRRKTGNCGSARCAVPTPWP
jgi:hypothetical protein